MPLPPEDPSLGDIVVTIDGLVIPGVIEVSGLPPVGVIEVKQQGSDGEYLVRRLPGRPKSGEFTITRGLQRSSTIGEWLRTTFEEGPPRSFEVTVSGGGAATESSDQARFGHCRIRSIEGGEGGLSEAVVIAFEEVSAS